MAELTNRERHQPCLLDRLTDDEPSVKQESREKRVMSSPQVRRSVLRDLAWLRASGVLTTSELDAHYELLVGHAADESTRESMLRGRHLTYELCVTSPVLG